MVCLNENFNYFLLFCVSVQYFRQNPYFENEVLCKEYALDTNGESMIKGTEIVWKPGKVSSSKTSTPHTHTHTHARTHAHWQNVTERVVAEVKERKRGHEDIGSFFLWFGDMDPSSDEPAELIKDDIWPNPLQYYVVSV